MLSNAYFLAKFRFDTAENEPAKNLQNFRKMQVGRAFLERAAAFIGELEADAELALLDPTEAAGAGREAEATARRVVAIFWQNFGKMLLVFGCIGTDFCKKICVLQHFSKSTRLSS